MRITSKGQVTIPQAIREEMGLLPETEVEFTIERGKVTLNKVPPKPGRGRGAEIVDELRRAGRSVTMTTDEIMALTRGDD